THSRRVAGIANDCSTRHCGRDLLEQLQPFPGYAVLKLGKSGGIAARPCEACYKASADRIASLREHDWYRAGCLQQCRDGRSRSRQDHIRGERNQFGRISAKAVSVTLTPADVDEHVTADRPARLLHALNERNKAGLSFRVVGAGVHEHAEAPHALALLRARRQRPHRCAAEQRDELAAPHHSITSSAIASSLSDTVRPSTLAALRLITSSNLVG